MEITWDVHGHTMWDAWKGRGSFDVVERDDGFIDTFDGSSYLAEFDEWPEIERKAMGLVKGRVVDLGCGAGRVALHLHLQRKGFDVVGLDISPLALKVCRRRGLRKVKLGSVQDLRFPRNSFRYRNPVREQLRSVGNPSESEEGTPKIASDDLSRRFDTGRDLRPI